VEWFGKKLLRERQVNGGGKENVENLQGFERQENLVDGDCDVNAG
jgi:hypothetical protein